MTSNLDKIKEIIREQCQQKGVLPSQLQRLSLYNNRISRIEGLEGLSQLQYLIISKSNIVIGPTNLQDYRRLLVIRRKIYGRILRQKYFPQAWEACFDRIVFYIIDAICQKKVEPLIRIYARKTS